MDSQSNGKACPDKQAGQALLYWRWVHLHGAGGRCCVSDILQPSPLRQAAEQPQKHGLHTEPHMSHK